MMPPLPVPSGTSMVRQSSHHKLNFEQAKEIDNNLNKNADKGGNEGIL
jgi:hypothetical protein